jgi:hypothetical protein
MKTPYKRVIFFIKLCKYYVDVLQQILFSEG